jgi:hypothetical protein
MNNDTFEVLQEGLLAMQVCTNIPPERNQDLNSLVRMSTISGTTGGWQLDNEIAPVQCAEKPNHWHYIFVC